MKISVAVRTKFHAFHLAQQLYERGLLHRLYTSFYGKFLHKNNAQDFTISPDLVSTHYGAAFLFYVLKTEKLSAFRHFGQWVASQLQDEQAIITFPLIALPILERAKALKIKTFITQASAHDVVHCQLLREAYDKLGLGTTKIDKIFSPARLEQTAFEYANADYLQVPSQFVAQSFISQGISSDKLLYAPLGVNLQLFYQPQEVNKMQRTDFQFIYAGQLSVRKGIIGLLQAFHQLRLPHAWLHLVGHIEEEIKPFLVQYSRQVVYHGAVSQVALKEKLAAAHVFVINSIEDGFAQVVPQAMACGLPVICTQNVGGADLVKDHQTGFVIPIHAIETLKEKLLYCYENPEQTAKMGKLAQETVSQFYTWQHYGDRLAAYYQKIL